MPRAGHADIFFYRKLKVGLNGMCDVYIMRVIKNPVEFRGEIKKSLSEKFSLGERDAINMEKAVYNWTIDQCELKDVVKAWENTEFVCIYTDKLRSIYRNGESVYAMLQGGESVIDVVGKTVIELGKERWSKQLHAKYVRESNIYESRTESMTDMFTCGKCKSKRTTYRTAQIRAADEPETIFVTCLDCGKKWKSQ